MAERVYNKLVRDNIPDLIRENGETPVIRTLDDGEYAACLAEKLREEVEEFLADSNLDELSDILEVLEALAGLHGWTDGEIQKGPSGNGCFWKRFWRTRKKNFYDIH